MNSIELIKIFALILFALFIFSCAEEETTEPTDENLLINTSFEKNGRFSSDGWTLPAQSDSSLDVPSGGGSFSLVLEATQPPEAYAQIKVPVKTEFNEFKLTFWSKYSVIEGKAILSLLRGGSIIKSTSITVDDIIWKSYSIQDTFSVATGDSFIVQLNAGITQLLPGKTYFDLCKLYGVE
ncbi:MAG: hypothetical protein HXY48_06685 [Ignavibacteriaceae bacterium]|nr:hypothetical protein [Ignavibacteriaceae bacterium]